MLKRLSSGPYLFWVALFIVIPLVMVLYFSFIDAGGHWTLDNYKRAADPLYVSVFWRSLVIAVKATGICLLLGYPMAMILAQTRARTRTIAVMLLVVPMWMNFLLRTYAWMTILGKNGVLNGILGVFGFEKMTFLYSEGAVLLGMVYNFLPFMVLPIYTVLSKMDNSLIEAAEDLGGNRRVVFMRVIFPLSIPGVISGVAMVFMPAVSTFVISNLLYGGQYMLVGNLIEQQFLGINDWHFGSTIAMILMVLVLISMAVLQRLASKNSGEKEVHLW